MGKNNKKQQQSQYHAELADSDMEGEEQYEYESEEDKYIDAPENNSDIMDNSDEEPQDDEESHNLQNWGAKKKDYYHDEDEESGDSSVEGDANEEGQAIYRLQRQNMDEGDFDLYDDEDENKKKADQDEDSDQETNNKNNKIQQNELIQEENQQKLKEDIEETTILLKEIEKSIANIEESDVLIQTKGVINRSKEIQQRFSKNFPELKKEINQGYINAIIYFLLLKKSGQAVKTHPIVKYLSEFREKVNQISSLDEPFQMIVAEILQNVNLEEEMQKQQKNNRNNKKMQQMKKKQSASSSSSQQQQQNNNNKQNQKLSFQQQKLNKSILQLNKEGSENSKKNDILDEEDEEDQRIRQGLKSQKQNKQQQQPKFDLGDSDSENINLDNIKLGGGMDLGDDLYDDLDNEKELQTKQKLQKSSKKVKKPKQKDEDMADQYYEMVKQQQISKKIEKMERKDKNRAEQEEKLDQLNSLKEVKTDGPRRINMTILQNKGLTRKRNTDISRVKLRKKFVTAKQKLKTMGVLSGERREKQKEYGGESGYIKPSVVRGVTLK